MSLLEKLDAKLLGWHTDIAETWQNVTRLPKEYLASLLYGLSATCFGIDGYVMNKDFDSPAYAPNMLYVFSGIVGFLSIRALRRKTPIEMDVSAKEREITGHGIADCVGYMLGVSETLLGIGLNMGIRADPDAKVEPGVRYALVGVGITLYSAARYISCTRPNPPRKRKPISERIKALLKKLSPKPAPESGLYAKLF